jgi:DHA2 family lincomycin resistance protein-like MFS transporter
LVRSAAVIVIPPTVEDAAGHAADLYEEDLRSDGLVYSHTKVLAMNPEAHQAFEALIGAITVVPLYLQSVLQVSALETGLIVLPGALAMGFAGPFIGRIYDRWGTKLLLVTGSIIASAMLWTFTTFNEFTPVWAVAVAQTVLSIGLALSFTPLFTASLASLQPRLYSYGSAVLGTVQQVAGAAGIALMFTILSSVSAGATAGGASELAAGAAGAQAAFTIAAIVSLPLILGAFFIRKPADQPFSAPAGH